MILKETPQFRATRVTAKSRPQPCSHQKSSDCYTPGHCGSRLVYKRPSFRSQPQMGDGNGHPSAQYSSGDSSGGRQQTQWTAEIGAVPKDCYYCRSSSAEFTGKCSQDAPAWGSGKDYMGNDCNACNGTGKCPRCGGDGMMLN